MAPRNLRSIINVSCMRGNSMLVTDIFPWVWVWNRIGLPFCDCKAVRHHCRTWHADSLQQACVRTLAVRHKSTIGTCDAGHLCWDSQDGRGWWMRATQHGS